MLTQKLANFFPSVLKKRRARKKLQPKKPEPEVFDLVLKEDPHKVIISTAEILRRPDRGWGRKRPRKLRCKLSGYECLEVIRANKAFRDIGLNLIGKAINRLKQTT